jgi:hypothetical protein
MTTEEFKKRIAESKYAEWCHNISYDFSDKKLNYDIQLKGLVVMHEYATQQIDAWKETGELPRILDDSKSFFSNFKERIENFVNEILDIIYYTESDSRLSTQWENQVLNHLRHVRSNIFIYELPETLFLLNLHKEIPSSFLGACHFILQKIDFHHAENQSQYFIGVNLAYEFKLKDKNFLAERKKLVENSFEDLSNALQKKFIDSSAHFSRYHTDLYQKFIESLDEISKLQQEKATSYTNWLETVQKDFRTFDSEAKTKTGDLEKTYAELLRLQGPAQYWKQRAETLNKKGLKATYWLTGVIIFTCAALYCLLWITPEGMLRSFFNGDAVAIKWSVIYVTFISFLAYLVRVLHRVAFSAFHLSRDAEEREQLTHVYLALIKDAAVDEKDKHLILQSLFSRADTGLLKDDSGPTMPGALVEKATR